jgi:hypothetical protein
MPADGRLSRRGTPPDGGTRHEDRPDELGVPMRIEVRTFWRAGGIVRIEER